MTDDRRLNVALIGCGMIARLAHLPHVVQSDRMRLSVCADLDREAAQTIGGKFNPDRITDDVDSVWDDASVDAVLIATPPPSHIPLATAALDAGKHVFMEKPVGGDAAARRAFAERVEQTGLKCMVGYCFRFNPMVELACEHVTPRFSLAHIMSHDQYEKYDYIESNLCHAIDVLRFCHRAEPVQVHAMGNDAWPDDITHVDRLSVQMRFDNDSMATVVIGEHGQSHHLDKWYYKLCGEDNRTAEVVNYTAVHLHPGDQHHTLDYYYQAHRAELERFVECIDKDTPAPVTVADALRTEAVIEAAFASFRSGSLVSIGVDP